MSRALLPFLTLLTFPMFAAAQTPGIAVGWDGHTGSMLLSELNCLSCHAGSATSVAPKQAPLLGQASTRVTPQFLRAYLADPQAVKPGTAMPSVLHAVAPAARAEAAEALTHFLMSLGKSEPTSEAAGATLSQVQRGEALFHSVGCVACHAPTAPPPKQKRDPNFDDDEPGQAKVQAPTKQAVPFGDLALKTTLPALTKFLLDPLHTRPSGRMPSLHLDPSEANAIAAYLLREQMQADRKVGGFGLTASLYVGDFKKVPDFQALKPTLTVDVTDINLEAVVSKTDGKRKRPNSSFAVRFAGELEVPVDGTYLFTTKSDDGSVVRIDGKLVVDNDGVHGLAEKDGSIQLKKGRHALEVGFLEASSGSGFELAVTWQPPGQSGKSPIPSNVLHQTSASAFVAKNSGTFELKPALVDKGRSLFGSLGCASCHQIEGGPASGVKAREMARLDPAGKGGCLEETVAAGRPRYAFDAEQRAALRKELGQRTAESKPSAAGLVDQHFNAFSCYACHARDAKGGPDKQRLDYFSYEIVVDLGDEGRLPPVLTSVGAKLTAAGFEDALFSGKRYRSTMATRMPNFGKANVGHVPELLAKADEGAFKAREPKVAARMVDDGRTLVGRQALSCVNCHAWGGRRLAGAEGLDLLETTRRLRPEWFHAWMLDPNAIRPGTRMPTSWPDGKSFFRLLQEGSVDGQIDAIWAYLKAGEKAGLPAGLAPTDSKLLDPVNEPIVFRTFLDRVGAHAILVGFPQKSHLAFDANRVRTVVAWSGDFVTTKAAWDGRAGVYAPIPSATQHYFPDGPPFARLASQTEPWPTDAPKQKQGSTRTPAGWHFDGYRFDAQRIPTFLYRFGNLQIEETPTVEPGKKGVLVQRFQITSPEPVSDLFFRAHAAKAIKADGKAFGSGESTVVRVREGGEPQVRAGANGQEVIIPIHLQPSGKTYSRTLAIETSW